MEGAVGHVAQEILIFHPFAWPLASDVNSKVRKGPVLETAAGFVPLGMFVNVAKSGETLLGPSYIVKTSPEQMVVAFGKKVAV